MAGIIAGLVMAALLAGMTAAKGGDIWTAFKGAGTPFLGKRSSLPGFDGEAVAVGVASHLMVSIVWGVLFGAIFYGIARRTTVLMGLLWGVVVWLVMYYIVLPAVGLGAVARHVPILQAVLSHMFFGLILGLAFAPFQPRMRRRTGPWLDRSDVIDRTRRPVY